MVCASHSWLSQGCPALVKLHRSTAGMAPAAKMRRPVARCHQRSELRMTLKQKGNVQAAPASSQRRWRPGGSRRSGAAGWITWPIASPSTHLIVVTIRDADHDLDMQLMRKGGCIRLPLRLGQHAAFAAGGLQDAEEVGQGRRQVEGRDAD